MIDVHQCATACGWAVPEYTFVKYRSTLNDFFEKKEEKYKNGKSEENIDRYWAFKSQLSIDGLPGMKRGVEYARKEGVEPLKKMIGKYAPDAPRTAISGSAGEPVYFLLVLLLGIVIGGAMAISFITPERLEGLRQNKVLF